MADVRDSIGDGENVTPVPEIEIEPAVVPANRPISRLTIPIVEDDDKVLMVVVPPLMHGGVEPNPAANLRRAFPPPTPAARTSGGRAFRFRHGFLGNPSGGGGDDSMTTTDFIKHCFTCKKQIGNMADVFMYKDKSFCSDDCRTKEMEKDIEEELKNREKMRMNRRNRKNPPPKEDDGKGIFFIGDN